MSKGFNKILDDFERGLQARLEESAPEGWSGTVKAMKKHKEIDNSFALANYMKKKGDTPHYAEESVGDFDAKMLKNIMHEIDYYRNLVDTAEDNSDMDNAYQYANYVYQDMQDLKDYIETNPSYASHPMVEKIFRLAVQQKIIKPGEVPLTVNTMTESGELWRGENNNPADPEILIHGFGRMQRSQLHSKIGNYLADMSEKAKQGNLKSVKYMIEQSPLRDLIDAALDAEKELEARK